MSDHGISLLKVLQGPQLVWHESWRLYNSFQGPASSGPVTSLTQLLSFPLTCLLPSLQIHWHTHTSGPLHMHFTYFAKWLAPFRSLLRHHFLTEAFPNHLSLKFQFLPSALPIFFHSFILHSTYNHLIYSMYVCMYVFIYLLPISP